jgi:hypothetical protein
VAEAAVETGKRLGLRALLSKIDAIVEEAKKDEHEE